MYEKHEFYVENKATSLLMYINVGFKALSHLHFYIDFFIFIQIFLYNMINLTHKRRIFLILVQKGNKP
jgi:hypothetical protein